MLAPKWVSYASTGQGPASASDASWVVGNFYWAFERAAWGSVEHLSAGTQHAGGRVWELWASTRGALGEQEESKQSASRGLGAPFTGHRGCWIQTFGTEGWSYPRHERTNVPIAQNLHGNIKWWATFVSASWVPGIMVTFNPKISLTPCDCPVRRPCRIRAHEEVSVGLHSKCDMTTHRLMCLWSTWMEEAGHGKQPLKSYLTSSPSSASCPPPSSCGSATVIVWPHCSPETAATRITDQPTKPWEVPFDMHLGHRYPQSDQYINIPGRF